MRARGAVWLSLMTVGCSASGGALELELGVERVAGARAALLAMSTDRSEPLQFVAVDLEAGPLTLPYVESWVASPPITTYALLYGESLAQLRLPPGPVRALRRGEAGRPLPASLRGFVRQYSRDDIGTWAPVDPSGPDPVLSRVRLPAELICLEFEREAHFLTGTTLDPTLAIPLSGKSLLVTTFEAKRVFSVELDPFSIQPRDGPDATFSSGFRDPDGTLWLGSGGAAYIFKGQLTASGLSLEVVHDLFPGEDGVGSMVGRATVQEPFELFYLMNTGNLFRGDGSESDPIYTFPGSPAPPTGIVRLGPGRALAFMTSPAGVVVETDGPSAMRMDVGAALTAGALVPGLGVVLGGPNVFLVRPPGGDRFDRLPAHVSAPFTPTDIIPRPDGFLAAGSGGLIAEYVEPAGEFCPPISVGQSDLRGGLVLEDGRIALLSRRGAAQEAAIILLRAR